VVKFVFPTRNYENNFPLLTFSKSMGAKAPLPTSMSQIQGFCLSLLLTNTNCLKFVSCHALHGPGPSLQRLFASARSNYIRCGEMQPLSGGSHTIINGPEVYDWWSMPVVLPCKPATRDHHLIT